jgi:hypothetical protein
LRKRLAFLIEPHIGPLPAAQLQRILEINTLAEVTKAVVEAARESLVIGPA